MKAFEEDEVTEEQTDEKTPEKKTERKNDTKKKANKKNSGKKQVSVITSVHLRWKTDICPEIQILKESKRLQTYSGSRSRQSVCQKILMSCLHRLTLINNLN